MKHEQQHHFFLYDPTLETTSLKVGSEITLSQDIATRIAAILRLRIREFCTLFKKDTAATIQLSAILPGKGAKITGTITAIQTPPPLQPEITLLCGVTKQTTFEEICYTATQLGVSNIFPITTTKSYAKAYTPKDFARFEAHMIAAAEQSKQIILPILHQPTTLEALSQTLKTSTSTKIVFETDGNPLKSLLLAEKPTNITIAFGPEGGFTPSECAELFECGFSKMQLCKPILRTQDAVVVGLGMIRSIF